jgi:Glucodextranase, domain B
MRTAHSISLGLVFLATAVACGGQAPPPPVLTVTSPARGLVQSGAGRITVTGTAMPSASGDPVARLTVNGVPAALQPGGSFTTTIDAPNGAMLLETVAVTDKGGSVTDTRAIQSGQLRKVGTGIDRAITAALSADAFTRLSTVAGPLLKTMDLAAMLAPMQPMMIAGDDLANVKLSVTALHFRDTRIALAPVNGGLSFTAAFDGLDVAANVAYSGVLVPDGSTDVAIHADQVTITGTLDVAPAGTTGFATQLIDSTVNTVGLKLSASGLAGQILDLLNSELGSTVQSMVSQSAELAMGPLVNQALGAFAGPQRIDVLGKKLDLQVSPSALTFTPSGALVALDLQALLEGSESSPGYIFTDNGAPAMDARRGFQLGLADDLVNELLAEVHALGLLDLDLHDDYGLFDGAQFHLAMPPMISANTRDGAMRLVIGDMKATFTHHGATVVKAAINAQVDLKIAPAANAQEVALQFGHVDLRVDVLDDAHNPAGASGDDLSGATALGVGIQLDSLSKLLITLPVPSVAGIQLEHLSIGADSGYVMMSGQIH